MKQPRAEETDSSGTSSLLSFQRIQQFLSRFVFHTDRSSYEQRLFEVTIREQSVPMIQSVLVIICFLILATWPTDFLLFETPVVHWAVLWRTSGTIFTISLWVALSVSRTIQRNVNITFIGLSAVLVGVAGFSMGNASQLTDIDTILTPWFDLSYLIPLLTTLVSVRVIYRLLSTTLITAVYVSSYLITFPVSSWDNPYMASALLTTSTSVVMCTFLGHAIYHLNRRDFFRERKLEEERQKIADMAAHDQLTGLRNYRSFHRIFEAEFNRSKRYGSTMTLLMMDLDYFKSINDNYGHLAGDQVLERVGGIIRESIRGSDIAARYGGEEFTILLPETDLERSKTLARRLREEIKESHFRRDSEVFSVTCSIGLAEYKPKMEKPDDMIREADEAMLEAKEQGRDRVVTVEG